MKTVDDHLTEFQPSDIRVESHRQQLSCRLQRPVLSRTPLYRRPALAYGMLAIVLLGGMTAIRPSWASELLHLVLVRERSITTPEGQRMLTRTYQSAPGSNATGGTVHLQANASGQITSETTQTESDPALEAVHVEAEVQVRSGQAQLFLEQDNMRWYRVTLRDGRHIVYTVGPGTSWSVSTNP
jgi:hypothetical protein